MGIASVALAPSLRVCVARDVSLEVRHIVGELVGCARQFANLVSDMVFLGPRQALTLIRDGWLPASRDPPYIYDQGPRPGLRST